MDGRSPRQLWLTLLVLTLITALAIWSAWPIYATGRLLLVGVAGAAIGVGVALITRARGWSLWVGAGVALLAFTLVALPLAVPSALGSPTSFARGLRDVLAAMVLDWKRLLTISIPVADYQTLMVPFLLLMVACTWAAVVLSTAPGRRSALAVVPMLAMVGFGAVFGSASAGRTLELGPFTVPAAAQVALAGMTLLVCGAWLIWRARFDRSDALRVARSQSATVRTGGTSWILAARRRLGSIGLVVAAAVAGLAFVPVTASLDARDALRESVLPPEEIAAQPSPLTVYRSWFTDEMFDQTLLTVSGDIEGQRLRLATLDTFDGQTFHIAADSAQFSRQPTAQASGITVTIGSAYSGVWVPVVTADGGAPTFLGDEADLLADSYYADPELDTAVLVDNSENAIDGLREGDSYTVAAAAAPSLEAISATTGGEPTVTEEQYPALAAWVEQQGLGRTGADLVELITRLRERGYLSHAAREDDAASWIADLASRGPYVFEPVRSGHTAARVDTIFQNLVEQELRAGSDSDESLLVAAVGDDEQFAASAAVLARYLGFESRVVVGLKLGTSEGTGGVQACATVCTGANVTAWVEVRAAQGEWVPVDVTPQYTSTPTRIRQGESLPENATDVDEPTSEAIEPPSVQREEAASDTSDTEQEPDETAVVVEVLVVILTVVSALLLILAPLLVLPFAKVLRRRWRRGQAGAESSMVGAWEELIDAYVDAGLEVPDRLTRGELADLLARDNAAAVAVMVDGAVFAERPPTARERDLAWELVDQERKDLSLTRPWHRRLASAMSPASLMRRARGDRPSAPLLSHPGRKANARR